MVSPTIGGLCLVRVRLVVQRGGEFVASGDAEFLVGPLQVAFHGPDRHLHLGGDLLVRPARGGQDGNVELAGCQPHPGRDEPDRRTNGPFTAVQQPRRILLGGDGVPGPAGASQNDGGLGARLGGVEESAQVLEFTGDLAEGFAVPVRGGSGVGGAGGHQIAVDLGGQRGEARGHVAGMAEAGQGVQRARGTDEVTSLLAEISRGLELAARGGEVTGCRRRPGPGVQPVGLVNHERREAEGVERSEHLGGPAGLSSQGQRPGCGGMGPLGEERAAELLEEGA